ncbi:non-heme iron oxygenase ferredoxin subunit [Aeromicrobium wangtongii]|uniref:Non-heme iron oxygenase ferredoxin subunit n=1 Tax=Aeromicrobium wangtongii TaxID=2969247 RepID=A0ABY5MB54_9ACTN|nr:non-heme iron oxygenase ferredoxin subunit [Aeromicrobium wangtongii]MCD9197870.1 non-heme iron oxygenase ferredoxin subunit [Aeromicrobium wangtongii]UUP15350.1 non-heme iron oxygenase ferredoxin subunit [Aeromicrobium wangtongii]
MSFTEAAQLADVPDGGVLSVKVDGQEIALVRDGDDVYAIRDECSHASIPLSEGEVEGCEIECWLHGSRFDVRTGKPLNLPATEPVPTYSTQIEGETVMVDLSTPRS